MKKKIRSKGNVIIPRLLASLAGIFIGILGFNLEACASMYGGDYTEYMAVQGTISNQSQPLSNILITTSQGGSGISLSNGGYSFSVYLGLVDRAFYGSNHQPSFSSFTVTFFDSNDVYSNFTTNINLYSSWYTEGWGTNINVIMESNVLTNTNN